MYLIFVLILEHPFDIDSHFEDNFYYVRYLNVCPQGFESTNAVLVALIFYSTMFPEINFSMSIRLQIKASKY